MSKEENQGSASSWLYTHVSSIVDDVEVVEVVLEVDVVEVEKATEFKSFTRHPRTVMRLNCRHAASADSI